MTIDELKEDVAYHCKSVHPRDNTAQTRIAKLLPGLIALWEAHEAWANAKDYDHEQVAMGEALDSLNDKLKTITFA